MVNRRKKALVIGGGIGGLSTALALRQAGLEVQVVEVTKEIREVGAGVTIWSNAVKALQQLDLSDALRKVGMPATTRTIMTWRGEILSKIRVDQLAHNLGAPILVCHRAEIQSALLHAFGEGDLMLGTRCIGCTQDEQGVCAQLEDGRELEGDLLIAADGIRSLLRTQLFGKRPLHYGGYTTWRGIASLEDAQIPVGVSSETWGCGCRIGLIPLQGGRMYWFAALNMREGEGQEETGEQKKQRMRALFSGWHSPIEATIEATEAETIIRAGIYEMEPLLRWHTGRITLLGDAAHPMTPNMGQGACQAIEDSVVLGKCMQAEQDIPAALTRYEAERYNRVGRVVKQSRRIGKLSQMGHPLSCAVRDKLVQQWYTRWLTGELNWLLGYKI